MSQWSKTYQTLILTWSRSVWSPTLWEKSSKSRTKAVSVPWVTRTVTAADTCLAELLIRGLKEQSAPFLHFLGILVITWWADMFRLKKLLAVGGFVFSHTWKVSLQNVTHAVNPVTFPYKNTFRSLNLVWISKLFTSENLHPISVKNCCPDFVARPKLSQRISWEQQERQQ